MTFLIWVGIVPNESLATISKAALCPSPRTILDTSNNGLSLELRKADALNDHHLPNRGGGVEVLLQTDECGAMVLQKVPELAKVLHVSAETRKLSHNNRVDLSFLNIQQHPAKCRTVHVLT
ncbi:MAG: hypothetical protein R3B54_00450 [Bdellovibrionota bacterium]